MSNRVKSEREDKRNIMSVLNTTNKKSIIQGKSSKFEEIESIEKEIMDSKITSLKKELVLKDKQIKLLRDKFNYRNSRATGDQSYESFNNGDLNEDMNNSYLNFEEDFNVTNNSNDSNAKNNDGENYDINEIDTKMKKKKDISLKIYQQKPEKMQVQQNSNAFNLDNEFKMFNKSREINSAVGRSNNNKSTSSSNNKIVVSNNQKGLSYYANNINNISNFKDAPKNIAKKENNNKRTFSKK